MGALQDLIYERAVVGLWNDRLVDGIKCFIVLNSIQESLLTTLGIDRAKIETMFNPCEPVEYANCKRNGAVFVGRMSDEKGVPFIMENWPSTAPVLSLIGNGPCAPSLVECESARLRYLGSMPREEARQNIARAQFLVMASNWYEVQPLVIVEAMAAGTPVLAPRLGGMESLIENGRTGFLYEPGDSADFTAKVAEISAKADAMNDDCIAWSLAHTSYKAIQTRLMEIYAKCWP